MENLINNSAAMETTTKTKTKKFKFSDKRDFVVIRKVLLGEVNAYDILFKKYKKRIFNKIKDCLKSQEDAEDVTMMALAKAFENLNKYKTDYTFNAWITSVANNVMIDFLRNQKSKMSFEIDSEGEKLYTQDVKIDGGINHEEYDFGINQKGHEIKDLGANPEFGLIKKEEKMAVSLAVDSLPERDKKIMTEIYYNGKTYEEVAREMSIPIRSLKPYIFRAKALVKENIKKQGLL